MWRILLVGVSDELAAAAARDYARLTIESAATGRDAIRQLLKGQVSGAVIGSPPTDMTLRELQDRIRVPVARMDGDTAGDLRQAINRVAAAAGVPFAERMPASSRTGDDVPAMFAVLTEERLGTIRSALSGGGAPGAMEEAARAANQIAGTASMFGREQASAIAEQMEANLRRGDLAGASSLWDELIRALNLKGSDA